MFQTIEVVELFARGGAKLRREIKILIGILATEIPKEGGGEAKGNSLFQDAPQLH